MCPARERREAELPALGEEEAVEVWRSHVAPRKQLAQRRRLAGDVEGEPSRRVPHRDRLDEVAGREGAAASRADAFTFYLGANLLTQLLPEAREIEALLDAGGGWHRRSLSSRAPPGKGGP